jgi:hypothetical protein
MKITEYKKNVIEAILNKNVLYDDASGCSRDDLLKFNMSLKKFFYSLVPLIKAFRLFNYDFYYTRVLAQYKI